jgi:hypothetical protein
MERSVRSRVRRIVLCLMLVVDVAAARAAGLDVVVDDDLRCPKATFTNLQDAIDFVGSNPGTITVCAGVYRGQFRVLNGRSLTLSGAKGAVIAPSFATSPLFTGVLLKVESSTDVTVQGLTFDGLGALQSFGDPNAIEYFASTGTIQKNTVTNWHRPSFGLPDIVNGKPAGALHAIHAIGFPSRPAGQPGFAVKIVKNTVDQYQERAIDLEGDLAVTVTSNRITAGLPTVDPGTFTMAINLHPAGTLGTKSPTGVVKSNTITGHGGSSGSNTIDLGILSQEVGSLTVAKNKLVHVVTGVTFFANCVSPAGSSNNVIQGNKINEAINAIEVDAVGGFPGACDPHADNYVVTGNRIVNNVRDPLDFGLSGILFDVRATGAGKAFALNETVKGNTITFYNAGVNVPAQPGGTITGVFEPNRILLAPL